MQSPSPTACADPTAARRLLVKAAALLWAAPVLAAAPAPASGSFFANFRGLALVDQDGQPLRTEAFADRLVLVHFVYTGCSTICPLQMRALVDLQQRLPPALRRRVRLLSVSLDPRQDTPAALQAYARRLGVDPTGWRLATGRPADIDRVADALRLFRTGADVRRPDDHSTAIWLVDGRGQLRMRYGGNPPDVPRLLDELATLDRLDPPHRPSPA